MKFLWSVLLVGSGFVRSILILGVLSEGVVLAAIPSRRGGRGALMMVWRVVV